MKNKIFIYVVFVILFAPVNGITDTIFFKDGTRLDVNKTWEENGQIKCELYGNTVGYPKDNLSSMSFI